LLRRQQIEPAMERRHGCAVESPLAPCWRTGGGRQRV